MPAPSRSVLAFTIALFAASLAHGQSAWLTVDQGKDWGASQRSDFYTRDQGSRMIPLAWLKALRLADGRPFLWDGLERYGYLANPANTYGLPVGFTVAQEQGTPVVGMTCAACHTRQISAENKVWRIDGGPALVDFQALLADLVASAGRALRSDADFRRFSDDVLGANAPSADRNALRASFETWYMRESTLMSRALPSPSWGLGRLDAVSMIFDRLSGLDLGAPPTYLIPQNIYPADAPVRYPFIWDAPRQDHTQWPGFAQNGDDLLGLARNLGEVYGVFGIYRPTFDSGRPSGLDYLNQNSAKFDGLRKLESLVRRMGSPRWPFAIDAQLAAQGKQVFARECRSCHGQERGAFRLAPPEWAWKTPVVDVHTDQKQYAILARAVSPGVMTGFGIPLIRPPLKPSDTAFNTLSVAVIGSILQSDFGFLPLAPLGADKVKLGRAAAVSTRELKDIYPNVDASTIAPGPHGFAYEARVLHGIWAAAPYLHNGSVPSLEQLLTPPAARVRSFAVGPNYDVSAVGLAPEQPDPRHVRTLTGCEDLRSGNSNCGHDYGTALAPASKRALIEYLKTV